MCVAARGGPGTLPLRNRGGSIAPMPDAYREPSAEPRTGIQCPEVGSAPPRTAEPARLERNDTESRNAAMMGSGIRGRGPLVGCFT